MSSLATAFVTGLLGSLHCAVMCGPLVTAGCSGRRGDVGRYALGRLVSYATVGAVFGHLGHQALMLAPVETVENVAVLLVAGYAALRGLRLLGTAPRQIMSRTTSVCEGPSVQGPERASAGIGSRSSPGPSAWAEDPERGAALHRRSLAVATKLLGTVLGQRAAGDVGGIPAAGVGAGGARLVPLRPRPPARSRGLSGAWLLSLLPRSGLGLGLVTGVLPCGLLASAWLLAMSTGQALGGALVMTVFGLASAPGLLLPWFGQKMLARRGLRLTARVQGVAWLLLALWIAARPLFAAAHCHAG